MKTYTEVEPGIYTEYDSETKVSRTLFRSELVKDIENLTRDIKEVPSDEDLLTWARDNHPKYKEIAEMEKLLTYYQSILEQL